MSSVLRMTVGTEADPPGLRVEVVPGYGGRTCGEPWTGGLQGSQGDSFVASVAASLPPCGMATASGTGRCRKLGRHRCPRPGVGGRVSLHRRVSQVSRRALSRSGQIQTTVMRQPSCAKNTCSHRVGVSRARLMCSAEPTAASTSACAWRMASSRMCDSTRPGTSRSGHSLSLRSLGWGPFGWGGVNGSDSTAPAQQAPGVSADGSAGTYLVIDLSGGPSASSYPVSYLSEIPAGGWTDEYRTTKLVMRRIPAGTFTMGSPSGELGRIDLREAQRQITLAKDYYIGDFQGTQKQWERVMGTWPSYFNNTAYRDSRPVEQVSYYDIRENPNNSAISPLAAIERSGGQFVRGQVAGEDRASDAGLADRGAVGAGLTVRLPDRMQHRHVVGRDGRSRPGGRGA